MFHKIVQIYYRAGSSAASHNKPANNKLRICWAKLVRNIALTDSVGAAAYRCLPGAG